MVFKRCYHQCNKASVTQDHAMQVGLVKKYSNAEAVSGLLNLVKMELGLGTDVGFTQVRRRKEYRE